MKIIFAQGNPGANYKTTRHNVGFMALDKIARGNNASFSTKSKFQAEVAELTLEGENVLLVKPTTFYNETGIVARQLIDFYKLTASTDFLVIHDELALPFGVVRTRTQGSDAGNNGIKSLNAHLGPQYARIRIGIYNSLRDQTDDANFVLGNFSLDEKDSLATIFTHVDYFIEQFLRGAFEPTSKTTLDKNILTD